MDSYLLNPEQELTILKAQLAAEQACIREYLPNVKLGGYGRIVQLLPSIEPLNYLSPTQAAQYGYHDPAAMELAVQMAPAKLSVAMFAEVDGLITGATRSFGGRSVPAKGCDSVGTLAVAQGIPVTQRPIENNDENQVYNAIQQINYETVSLDSRVTAADAKWSACMAAHGYNYPNPGAASNNEKWAQRTGAAGGYAHPVSLPELKTATADVACRQQANLYAVYWAVAAAYQKQWLARPANLALAREQQKVDQVMLTRAEKILGG
jgi:hypothetical protein